MKQLPIENSAQSSNSSEEAAAYPPQELPEVRPNSAATFTASERGKRSGLGVFAAAASAWVVAGKTSSWLASALVHASVVVLLSLLMLVPPGSGPTLWLEGSVEPEVVETLDLEMSSLATSGHEESPPSAQVASLSGLEGLATSNLVMPPQLERLAIATRPRSTGGARESIGQPLASRGGGLEGRRLESRRALALGAGGNAASETAVERGLAWLAAHQGEDGGWRFNLKLSPPCAGACRNSGVVESTTAPTGLALLCFLGAGYTQHEGPYQETVAKGLYFLTERMVLTSVGGDLRDTSLLDKLGEQIPTFRKSGDMYSHGIATLALCEAYAMTRDKNLAQPAQEAVNFIVYAQHKLGGWRYEPKEPGDTTVSGWQVTALKSALLGKLKVPREVWYRASEYFDGVQEDRGATYGYQAPSKTRRSTTIVGLYCRMILGWPREHPPLRKGMSRIAKQKPQQNHMYFNYYATQAIFHLGGPGWKRWNPQMRNYLLERQASEGHEAGSWYINEEWSDRGGRLYTTTLAILTLEVYYRYMPMYREAFVGDAP